MTSAPRQERKAFVRLDDEKERLAVSFKFESALVPNRLFTIDRRQDEPIEISLARLQKNVSAFAMKKFHKRHKFVEKKSNDDPNTDTTSRTDTAPTNPKFDLKITVEDANGTALDPSVPNREAFQTGNFLNVGGTKLPIVLNAPTVVRISLPKQILMGFPIQAYVSLENANLKDCIFSWWRLSRGPSDLAGYAEEDIRKAKTNTWLRIRGATSYLYEPVQDDLGKNLLVCCEPREGAVAGVEATATSVSAVNEALDKCYFEERHLLTQEVLPVDRFRVVSYNLLANIYADTDFSKKVLFHYCSQTALDFQYRKHLLVKELMGYNGDVLCLQEVDVGMFYHELSTCLATRGFKGLFEQKGVQAREGCAVFFRTSKFSLVDHKIDYLSEAMRTEDHFEDLRLVLQQNEKLLKRLRERNTILQRVLLQHKETGTEILFCNTHLYFHPDADHIRLLQIYIAVRLVEEQLRQLEEKNGKKCAVIFCGDFNSCPEFGVYQLLTTGKVPHTSEDWRSNDEEAITGFTATINQVFYSAYGTPAYTNFTVDFKGCLDYIFYSEEITVDSVVPLPPHDVLAHPKYRAIPSPCFPSDHLALVANMRFNEETK